MFRALEVKQKIRYIYIYYIAAKQGLTKKYLVRLSISSRCNIRRTISRSEYKIEYYEYNIYIAESYYTTPPKIEPFIIQPCFLFITLTLIGIVATILWD